MVLNGAMTPRATPHGAPASEGDTLRFLTLVNRAFVLEVSVA